MVGGTVSEVIPIDRKKVWVNCVDFTYGLPEFCAIYCDPLGFLIKVGDSLWWQGNYCYWTPSNASEEGAFDIQLPRIGYSHRSRPEAVIRATTTHTDGEEKR